MPSCSCCTASKYRRGFGRIVLLLLIAQLEGHQGLRMQRRRHVYTLVIPVGAFEADEAGRRVGAYTFKERPHRRAGPLADHAPAFDADVPRDLALPGQFAQPLRRPGPLVSDAAGQHQAVVAVLQHRRPVRLVIGVEAKIPHRLAFGELRRQPPVAEQPCLHAVVPSGHAGQCGLHRIRIADIAAGQEGQRAERQCASGECASVDHGVCSRGVGTEARPKTMACNVRGTSATSATWTRMKPQIALISRK